MGAAIDRGDTMIISEGLFFSWTSEILFVFAFVITVLFFVHSEQIIQMLAAVYFIRINTKHLLVLKLITTYHGKKSSLADFSIALLERYQKALAMRLIHVSFILVQSEIEISYRDMIILSLPQL